MHESCLQDYRINATGQADVCPSSSYCVPAALEKSIVCEKVFLREKSETDLQTTSSLVVVCYWH